MYNKKSDQCIENFELSLLKQKSTFSDDLVPLKILLIFEEDNKD